MYEQIKTHIDAFNILPQYQSGFCSNYSSLTALLTVINDILSAIDMNFLQHLYCWIIQKLLIELAIGYF